MSSSSEIKIWSADEDVMEFELPKPDPSQPEPVHTSAESCDTFTVFQKIKQLPASQDDVVQQIDDLLAEDQTVVTKREPVVAPPKKEIKIPERGYKIPRIVWNNPEEQAIQEHRNTVWKRLDEPTHQYEADKWPMNFADLRNQLRVKMNSTRAIPSATVTSATVTSATVTSSTLPKPLTSAAAYPVTKVVAEP